MPLNFGAIEGDDGRRGNRASRRRSPVEGRGMVKKTVLLRLAGIGCAILLSSLFAFAQEHKWAGRTLNDLEWRIHEELARVPFNGVFDSLRFELRDKAVILSGQVLRESVKADAERVVKRLDGVDSVVNQVQVLPSSRRDDAIRMNVYRAIYERQQPEQYGTRALPPIHIIVKDGYVTLEGAVDSELDRAKAHLQALKAALHVTNNLRVAPEA
jgi:hyperosmotically inducible periplasmic protein